MDPVRMVTVKSVNSPDEAPACTNHSNLPAIVFSDRGYAFNLCSFTVSLQTYMLYHRICWLLILTS
jgi:hypothetical protein